MATHSKTARVLDRLDKKILRELQREGRLSYVELGERVGLSTSPCLERVKRLEREGFIASYHAVLEPTKLNAALLIYVEISLNYTSSDIFEEFREAVRRWPQIMECHLVAGDFDYLLKIRMSNMTAYRQLLGDILHTLPGVRDSRTLVVMESVKESSHLVIEN